MSLFIGYDGGGTKTACVIADDKGRLLGTGIGGPSNYLYCGKEMAAASVQNATERAFRKAGMEPQPFETAYMASAAILLGHGESHVPFFSTCIDAKQVICESDIYPIWYGSVGTAPAAVSIAGTGALTYICSDKGFTRVSGWGPLLGDEGSGYDLALRALRTACRMYDGRVAMDELFLKGVFAHYEAETPFQILRALRTDDTRSKVASCARVVFGLYEQGSPTAKMLMEETADEIALAVCTAANNSECAKPLPVVFSGSLVEADRALYPLLQERLLKEGSPICSVHSLQVHPAVASAALALHAAGLEEAAMTLLENSKGVEI